MGLPGRRKPILPAPTESLVDSTAEETGVSEDIATDLSRRTDRTSATIPDDGSPVTITTGPKSKTHKLAKISDPSQTSLLIEYYEGVKETGSGRRPSLRVRVRPSGGKSKEIKGDGHIVVTQEQGTRKSSITRHIPLTSRAVDAHDDDYSVRSSEDLDATPLGHRPPIDIEIGDRGSDLSNMSASPELRQYVEQSDISSMPADSMLGAGVPEVKVAPPANSSLVSGSEISEMTDLRPPVMPKERNLSHERITQKAIEKLSKKERVSSRSSSRRHSDKGHTRGTTVDIVGVPSTERRRKTSRHYGEESSISTNTEPSQISNSLLSTGAKSMDGQSVRSGASNITNPKLLQTVEDAIRRLILPELKEIKRHGSQRNRYKDEDMYSDLSENSIAREKEASRRVSSGSKSKRRISKESTGSASRNRDRQYRDLDYDSISDISSPRKESISSVSEHRNHSRDKSHRVRDVAVGALAGTALTTAALHHQDSSSTLDRRRRRKRSKSRSSRSRSASVNESEEIFAKHDVPPMPFHSEIGSEMTRSSILSSNTASTATPTQREVREVIRGSPLGEDTPTRQASARASNDLKQSLGMHHKNFSEHDLSANRSGLEEHDERTELRKSQEYSPEIDREQAFSTAYLADPERLKQYERNLHQQHPIRRGLSPIQSVASYATTEPNRNSMMHARSIDSIASMKKRQQELKQEVSIDSFASASPELKSKGRPQGINLENPREVLQNTLEEDDEEDDDFYEEQHSQNERYRESYASSDYKNDSRRFTGYTDDSLDTSHPDKVTAGQQVAKGYGANPEFVNIPTGVESAVASLIEPSVLDMPGSPHRSVHTGSYDSLSSRSAPRDTTAVRGGSPLKEVTSIHLPIQSQSSFGKTRQYNGSPPQSPAHSFDGSHREILNVPSAEPKAEESPESEITTNPSVIQGPIGGLNATNSDHWPYGTSPERAIPNFPAQQALNRDLAMHAPDLIPPALNVSQRNTYDPKKDMYDGIPMSPTPPNKDEGYATGDNPRSPDSYGKHAERAYTPGDTPLNEDPFTTKKSQYVSGLSHGMSPLYDSATGRGMEHIQSKDIVALMDHLTVRDAQRNARDTEILITLVRSAAEMRNSFEDMKKFIAEQDDMIMDVADQQHEKTQKIIGGPRPQPMGRPQQKSVTSQDDLPKQRRNIFKRALQGLGSKNEKELQNIEQMLMQLLDDVESLRIVQGGAPISHAVSEQQARSLSNHSADNARAPTDPGYEPEGQAGTSSTGDRSGFFSGNSSRQTDYRATSGHRPSSNRVSTVMEGNEDEPANYDDEDNRLTPRASPNAEQQYRHLRGQSAPAETPPKMHERLSGPWSHDQTPQFVPEPTSAGRKHKSIASSIFGKGFVSRWSKTTASTMPDNRQSVQKPRPFSQVSRGGSDYDGYTYDPQPEDRLRSNTSLQDHEYHDQENRPPSPLVPSQVSEDPKYQGYRNSQNLQHPQPRQGPTGRFQHKLETEAQTYHDQFSPTSQTSSHQWEGQQGNTTRDPHAMAQYVPQAPLSPISDGGYSERSDRSTGSSRRGPPRPPKVVDDEPLVPQRTSQMGMSPSNYVDHVTAARAGSPAYDKSPVAALRSPQGSARKPSGPRPLSSTGMNGKPVKGDLNAVKKTRFRGSPYQIDDQ